MKEQPGAGSDQADGDRNFVIVVSNHLALVVAVLVLLLLALKASGQLGSIPDLLRSSSDLPKDGQRSPSACHAHATGTRVAA